MTASNTKPHVLKIDRLSPAQQQAVFDYCRHVNLEEGLRWIEAEFGLQLKKGSLSRWLSKERGRRSTSVYTRKTRPDSRLGILKPDQQELVFAACKDLTLEKGVPWIEEHLKIQVSAPALSRWLKKKREDKAHLERFDKIRDASEHATLIRDAFGTGGEITDANIVCFTQAVFEEFTKDDGNRDEKRLVRYMDLALKARDQELKARGIELGVEKFKAALRTKLEAGLEALAQEIQGNDHAMAKYRELKEELSKAA
jgi:hypothetical protein